MSGQQARPAPTTMPITATDIAAGFACGEPGLDEFFVRHALANHRRGIGSTFVLHDNNAQVLGYYTLSMADVDAKNATAEGFYQHYGFVIIDEAEWPHRLFLPMATLVAAVGP